MKNVLCILNDCMRKFSYERTAGLYRAFHGMDEPVNLYYFRSDTYFGFAPEHNRAEYNIYRLPDYRDFDGIFLDINSVFGSASKELQYAIGAAAASGKPVISMANHIPGFHYVGIDNHEAMASVIRHLHQEQGLTDFWFAMGPKDNFENRLRTQGLLDYCAANRLPCGEDRFYAESFIVESGIHAFEALRARHGGSLPQAIICANDRIALGVCHAAQAAGFSIPRDMLVTGFDNSELSLSASPTITSVDQGAWSMGEICADAMRRIWQGESVPEAITIPTELILRESTGHAAPASRARQRTPAEYIGSSSSSTNFNYKLSAMQYLLPGCRRIEEICQALVDCVSELKCDGVDLVLDGSLFDSGRLMSFRDHQAGQMRDITDGMPAEGYSDTLELIFSWEAGGALQFPRRRIGRSLSALKLNGGGNNYLVVPLHFMEYAVGYLCLRNGLDLIRIMGVSAIVSTLTMALQNFFARRNLSFVNHMLSGLSMKDGLTGLYNRLGYHELAHALYQSAASRGERLAILFIDMDRMKHINDTYGHAVGDLAIKSVSNAIAERVPEGAIPVRYGGDEFLVILPVADQAVVAALADAIAASIPGQAQALNVPESPEISTGFVLTEADSGKSLDDCVEAADALMYAQKKAKRAHRQA